MWDTLTHILDYTVILYTRKLQDTCLAVNMALVDLNFNFHVDVSESHGGLVSASYGQDDVSRVEEGDEKVSENEDSDDSTRNSVSFSLSV